MLSLAAVAVSAVLSGIPGARVSQQPNGFGPGRIAQLGKHTVRAAQRPPQRRPSPAPCLSAINDQPACRCPPPWRSGWAYTFTRPTHAPPGFMLRSIPHAPLLQPFLRWALTPVRTDGAGRWRWRQVLSPPRSRVRDVILGGNGSSIPAGGDVWPTAIYWTTVQIGTPPVDFPVVRPRPPAAPLPPCALPAAARRVLRLYLRVYASRADSAQRARGRQLLSPARAYACW